MKQPMLAGKNPKTLLFPRLASAKIDGIRAVVKDGILLSRTLKPIPNTYTQELFGVEALEGLDGELTVGPYNSSDLMQRTTSGVMTEEGEPDVTYWVFDFWTHPNTCFSDRYKKLELASKSGYIGAATSHSRVKLLPHYLINDMDELEAFEAGMLSEGFEGIMSRTLSGPYKYGRSTGNEGYLIKHKRFKDAEAVIIGFEERMHNANESKTDERGYAKRSSHKDNLIPMGTLGSFRVRDSLGREFNVGTGMSDAQRAQFWAIRETLVGTFLTYKSFEMTGVKNLPRFPVFKAFRDVRDIGLAK